MTQAEVTTGFLSVEDWYSTEIQMVKCHDEENGDYFRFKVVIEYKTSMPIWDIHTNSIAYINSNEYWLYSARKTFTEAEKFCAKLGKRIIEDRIEGL